MSFFTSIFLSNVLVGQNDGLPNITGSLGMTDSGGSGGMTPTGAFSNTTLLDRDSAISGSGGKRYIVNFDASLSNKIYGNNNTVQPKNITVKLWQRIS